MQVIDTHVQFFYQSHRSGKKASISLTVDAFVTHWLQHVPIRGKASVRYYGRYSSAARHALNSAREHFQQSKMTKRPFLNWQTIVSQWLESATCKIYGSPFQVVQPGREVQRREAA